MFTGVITALVTPFKNQKVDLDSLDKLVRWQLDQGVDGFVVNGTTAESPTLTTEEVEVIWKRVKSIVPPGFPLLLGTGTNCTRSTITNTQKAVALGASGALVVVPYYNKPPQEGLYEHFCQVANAVKDLPILLYNVPGRTVISMSAETTARLSAIKNIVGIKEASGDMQLGQHIVSQCPSEFTVTSGDDFSCIELMTLGAKGVISVISHIIPKELKTISLKACEGDRTAQSEYSKYNDLNRWLFCEPNPIPVKMALHMMGIIAEPEVRLPLVKMTSTNSQQLKSSMQQLGVL
ncbi:MAG: 4-hydroxy-tetrahydrodipicolinate synthase [Bdellovibrionales bacterium]|nr:4-hydroxy-tetrahydrodipicolinate synthase [Bdellovibrionales bacterium]